jgi:hypothetical protein
MTKIRSFKDVILLWPSKESMASEVSASLPAVIKWWQRNSIPVDRWSAVLSTDKAREAGVTSDLLIALAARETVEART